MLPFNRAQRTSLVLLREPPLQHVGPTCRLPKGSGGPLHAGNQHGVLNRKDFQANDVVVGEVVGMFGWADPSGDSSGSAMDTTSCQTSGDHGSPRSFGKNGEFAFRCYRVEDRSATPGATSTGG